MLLIVGMILGGLLLLALGLAMLAIVARITAMGLAGAVALGVTAWSLPPPEGPLLGLLFGALAARWTWRRTRVWTGGEADAPVRLPRSRRPDAGDVAALGRPGRSMSSDAMGDRAEAAWRILDALSGGEQRIAASREACAEFLARAAEAGRDPDRLSLALAIRDNLPDLVERTLRLPARSTERAAAEARLLDSATTLGERAAEEAHRLMQPDRDALAAAQAHLDAKLRKPVDPFG